MYQAVKFYRIKPESIGYKVISYIFFSIVVISFVVKNNKFLAIYILIINVVDFYFIIIIRLESINFFKILFGFAGECSTDIEIKLLWSILKLL